MTMNLETVLKQEFGYETFRPGQKEIITSLLSGRDTIGVLPTGTGKTLCYQFVGHLAPGHVLIVSPLLSLMQDQVEQMKSSGEKRVIAINSFLTTHQKNLVMRSLSHYKFIFISPEMLQIDFVLERLKPLNISLFVIDEAHCISQWGHDFRTDYLKLGNIKSKLSSPLTLALTATATHEVRNDIIQSLNIKNASIYETTIDRPNIAMKVETYEDSNQKQDALLRHLKNLNGPGIIYFSSKKLAEITVERLKKNGVLKVAAYHGGMTHEDRILIQQQFLHGQLDYICATSAFGMGINKEDIRFVIHFHMPLQMESYLQEIGRAGRDTNQSIAILLYSRGDENLALQLAEGELPSSPQLDWLFNELTLTGNSFDIPEELCVRGGFSEIQWRLTLDFINTNREDQKELKHILDEFKQFIAKRKNYKVRKIYEMIQFIKHGDCRRLLVLDYFNNSYPANKVSYCCDNCGLELTPFLEEKKSVVEGNTTVSWVTKLTKLLTPSQNNNVSVVNINEESLSRHH
jgi:ATP-dependent DNA helicase RecQ